MVPHQKKNGVPDDAADLKPRTVSISEFETLRKLLEKLQAEN